MGDVLFVAGELDIMAFDMSVESVLRNPGNTTPPLLGTCGTTCGHVGKATGQNFHSIDYRAQGGRHFLFISAQIDNAVGCVEITDDRIIQLLG